MLKWKKGEKLVVKWASIMQQRTQRVELAIAQPHSVEQMGRRSVIYGLRAGVIGGLLIQQKPS